MDIPEPVGGDVNIGGTMMETIWTLYAFTIIVVALRLYAQYTIARKLGLGDVMMTLSLLTGIGLCSMLTVQYHYGLGRHFFYLDPYQKVMVIKFNFIGQAFGVMAPGFGRMACCMLMLQLFGTTKYRRWGLWALFWESLIVNGLVLILIYAQCKDVRSLWDPVGHPSKCWSPNVQEYTGFIQGGLNSAVDLALTILPATIFWTLQISNKLKIGLAILLGLSIFAFIACVIKTVLLQSLESRGDFTFNTVPFFTWVVVEITLVNIAASVPLIRPLFLRYQKSHSTSNETYEMKNRYGGGGIGASSSKNKSSGGSKSLGTHLTSHHNNNNDFKQRVGDDLENSSLENILPLEGVFVDQDHHHHPQTAGSAGDGKIIMSTTYAVSYDNVEEEEEKGGSGPTSGGGGGGVGLGDVKNGAKAEIWADGHKVTPWPSPVR